MEAGPSAARCGLAGLSLKTSALIRFIGVYPRSLFTECPETPIPVPA
jgi:hypothetical protein